MKENNMIIREKKLNVPTMECFTPAVTRGDSVSMIILLRMNIQPPIKSNT